MPIVRTLPKGEEPKHDVLPQVETPPDRLTLTAVRFCDPEHGHAVGYYSDVGESVVIGTEDGGASWKVERLQLQVRLIARCLANAAAARLRGGLARSEHVGSPRLDRPTLDQPPPVDLREDVFAVPAPEHGRRLARSRFCRQHI